VVGVINSFGGPNMVFTNGGLSANANYFDLSSGSYSNAGAVTNNQGMTFTAVGGSVVCFSTCTASNGLITYTTTLSKPSGTRVVTFVPASGLSINCVVGAADGPTVALSPWYYAGGAGIDGIAFNASTSSSGTYHLSYNCF